MDSSFVLLPHQIRYPILKTSSSAPPNTSETDGTSGGRERRTRKSMNYELKFNTYVQRSITSLFFHNLEIFRKMRNPDPSDSSDPLRLKKRSSAAAVLSATAYKSPDAMDMGNEADADTVRGSFIFWSYSSPITTVGARSGLCCALCAPWWITSTQSFSHSLFLVLGLLQQCTRLGHQRRRLALPLCRHWPIPLVSPQQPLPLHLKLWNKRSQDRRLCWVIQICIEARQETS